MDKAIHDYRCWGGVLLGLLGVVVKWMKRMKLEIEPKCVGQ